MQRTSEHSHRLGFKLTQATDNINRAGYYAENLLLYSPQAQEEQVLPFPVRENHKFAPIAVGDIAQVAVHVLSEQGRKKGFSDKHCGQLIVLTGFHMLLLAHCL